MAYGPITPGRRKVKARGDTTFVQVGGHGADVDTSGLDPAMIGTLRGNDDTGPSPRAPMLPAGPPHPVIPHPFNLGTAISNAFRGPSTAKTDSLIAQRKQQNAGIRFRKSPKGRALLGE